MRPLTATLAVLILGCGGAAPEETTTPSASRSSACTDPDVDLRFAWPEGLSARVVGLDLTESANEDGSAPMRGESRSQLTLGARQTPQGLAVRFDVAGETRTRSQGFAPDIAGVRPTVVLGAEGDVVAVTGADLMRGRVQELQNAGQLSGEDAAMILPNLSDAAQLDTARSHWRWVTRIWHGRHMSCGQIIEGREMVPGMGLGAARLEARVRLIYERALPCPSVPDRQCVALRTELAADAVQDSGSVGDRTSGAARLVGGSVERKIRVIVEPDTLVPHQVQFDERQRLRWQAGAQRVTRLVRDLQSYEMDYGQQQSTQIMIDPERGGYAVLDENGQPVQLPPTPTCRRFSACCAAAAQGNPSVSMMCAMFTTQVGEDCTEELEAISVTIRGGGGAVPPECDVPITNAI